MAAAHRHGCHKNMVTDTHRSAADAPLPSAAGRRHRSLLAQVVKPSGQLGALQMTLRTPFLSSAAEEVADWTVAITIASQPFQRSTGQPRVAH